MNANSSQSFRKCIVSSSLYKHLSRQICNPCRAELILWNVKIYILYNFSNTEMGHWNRSIPAEDNGPFILHDSIATADLVTQGVRARKVKQWLRAGQPL